DFLLRQLDQLRAVFIEPENGVLSFRAQVQARHLDIQGRIEGVGVAAGCRIQVVKDEAGAAVGAVVLGVKVKRSGAAGGVGKDAQVGFYGAHGGRIHEEVIGGAGSALERL